MFGSSLVSSHRNEDAGYWRGLLRALHSSGHRISFYEPDAFGRQQHRDLAGDPDYARVVVYAAGVSGLSRALHDASHADVVIKTSGVGVFDRELEESVLALREHGRAVVYWDLDAIATLRRLHLDAEDYFRPLVSEYDLVLARGAGESVARAYELAGARRCISTDPGVDPDEHRPAPIDPRFEGALGYLGPRLAERDGGVSAFFFGAARSLPGERFLLGGDGWRGIPDAPANVLVVGHVHSADRDAFCGTPRGLLCFGAEDVPRLGPASMQQLLEAASAGACLFTDRWQRLERMFEPDRECVVVRDGAELAARLRELTPEAAALTGARARRRVLEQHTYERRGQEVGRALLEAVSRRPRAVDPASAVASTARW